MIDPNTFALDVQPGTTINGIVGGFIDNGEDFTLNFSGGSVIVDPFPVNANQLGLNIGEPINVVVAEFDGLEVDTGFISRSDGVVILGNQAILTPPQPTTAIPTPSPPLNPPPPVAPLDPITGGVSTIGFDPLTFPQGNSIFGTVLNTVDRDEFILDAGGTQVFIDANLSDRQFLNLFPGEQVNVVGEFDENEFEAFSVTRTDGSPVVSDLLPGAMPPVTNTLFGTVLNTVDNDEFILDAGGTQVFIDANLSDRQFLNLFPGEQVNVVGEFDENEFEAFSVTRTDGSPVVSDLLPGAMSPVSSTLLGTVLNDNDGYDDDDDDRYDEFEENNEFEAFATNRSDGYPVISEISPAAAPPVSSTLFGTVLNDNDDDDDDDDDRYDDDDDDDDDRYDDDDDDDDRYDDDDDDDDRYDDDDDDDDDRYDDDDDDDD
ncbi:hypothetical protein [Okeania sp. SIO1F9]|uniref:hypothetical protein n=1 Tax=Okeania sp. SIO1F9 TaxID=2607813 RepID=UPI00144FCD92|nr:hypothetical protein [Okeania sp. SIO1F9]NET74671.1 hypothetical protein [Okeania sp. SIO1F9]